MTAVLFRCDATVTGGIGHFVRVMALAEEWGSRGRTAIISGDVEAPLAQEMLQRSAAALRCACRCIGAPIGGPRGFAMAP